MTSVLGTLQERYEYLVYTKVDFRTPVEYVWRRNGGDFVNKEVGRGSNVCKVEMYAQGKLFWFRSYLFELILIIPHVKWFLILGLQPESSWKFISIQMKRYFHSPHHTIHKTWGSTSFTNLLTSHFYSQPTAANYQLVSQPSLSFQPFCLSYFGWTTSEHKT